MCENKAVALSNYLLNGPPGIGKTAACNALAKVLLTPFRLISLSTMTASFVLSGSSSSWSEGKNGKITGDLAYEKIANLFFLLDEIDKAGGDKRYSPYSVLINLLEPETSRVFVDEGIEVATDCSYINTIATSNYRENIPEPVLSRFIEIEVSKPTDSQMPQIIHSIYMSVLQENRWGTRFEKTLDQRAIDKLISSRVEPRLMKKIITQACGRQALKQLEKNTEEFLSLEADDIVTQSKKTPISTKKTNERYYIVSG